MDINLTPEQINDFLEDAYVNINLGDYRIYYNSYKYGNRKGK